MAVGTKLLRSNITVLAAYPEAFADPANPTAAELNDQFVYGTNEDAMVFNISCAILDDGYTANVTDSETDDSRTICDIGQVANPTFTTYEVSFDAFRDQSVTDPGLFNLFAELFRGVDRPYWIITRIGKENDEPFDTDGSDVIKQFGVTTDFPNDLIEDNSMVRVGARFKNTGEISINYRVEA